eukprot:tig00000912_g5408.t1
MSLFVSAAAGAPAGGRAPPTRACLVAARPFNVMHAGGPRTRPLSWRSAVANAPKLRSGSLRSRFGHSEDQRGGLGQLGAAVCRSFSSFNGSADSPSPPPGASPAPPTTVSQNIKSFASNAAKVVAGMGVLGGLDAVLTAIMARGHVRFPPSLVGMSAVFVSMCLLRTYNQKAAYSVEDFFKPTLVFLTRYMPMFFVPPLVVLPVVPKPSLIEAAKLALVCAVGFAFTLISTAKIVKYLRKASNTSLDVPSPDQANKQKKSKPSLPEPRLIATWTCITALGCILPLKYGLGVDAAGAMAAASEVFGPRTAAAALQGPQSDPRFLTSLVTGFGNHPAFLAGPFSLGITVSSYLFGTRGMTSFLHPLIFCSLITSSAISLLGIITGAGWQNALGCYLANSVPGLISFGAGDLLMRMLGPSIISLGFRLYKQRQLLSKHRIEIVGGIFSSAALSLLFTSCLVRLLAMPPETALVALPRSVTTPIAIQVAGILGSSESLTAALVILSGVLGANFARRILTTFGIEDSIARGVAVGAASHGVGTGELVAREPESAPMSAVALTLMGMATVILVAVPPIRYLLVAIATGARIF